MKGWLSPCVRKKRNCPARCPCHFGAFRVRESSLPFWFMVDTVAFCGLPMRLNRAISEQVIPASKAAMISQPSGCDQ